MPSGRSQECNKNFIIATYLGRTVPRCSQHFARVDPTIRGQRCGWNLFILRSFTRLAAHTQENTNRKILQRQLAPEEVLGTPEGVTAFAKWAPATWLFHRRYGTFGTTGEGDEDGA